MLGTLVALLIASVVMVPISRRLGFGAVLGNLVGGAVIGPLGLGLVHGVGQIANVSELGVVMLLFLIGLELRPERLWVMRRAVFGLGTAQVLLTGMALAILIHLAVGSSRLGWAGAIVFGLGLALSSTAIVLPMLGERSLLSARAGRDAFAVLLFQDVAFIPMVALVPLLAMGVATVTHHVPWQSVLVGACAIAGILLGGRFLVPRLFRLIGGARSSDIFTATALLTVLGTAWIASLAGLSMSLGAFLAGVLLSGSEYRHELQADIEPFEGVLLGFFFLSVGMSAHLDLLAVAPGMIALCVVCLLLVKAGVAFGLARGVGQSARDAIRFALALPQGSEFSFVLFAAAIAAGVLPRAQAEVATLVIALSMAATPILFAASERLVIPALGRAPRREDDRIAFADAPVIICGFGRMGQIVGRVLRTQGIAFTALEQDADQIETIRRFGNKVYYGNPARPDLLRAAGADTAKLLVVALADPEESLRVIEMVRRNFPRLRILARARNRRHAHLLMRIGVSEFVRETFHSSLVMTELALVSLGREPADARRVVENFRALDTRSLAESATFYDDEKRLIQSARQVSEELTGLFQADRPG
ncbi:monovalent cation:proton antiporter-2 (CPA2) family protein [Lichenicoccus sp.]|uniref:monovalent cation:proton antiporter-2 (CPA2) family protein n=1 Tax=Lichenicoccus sp. TaxID=2781899 RepID=UPI003D0A1A2B